MNISIEITGVSEVASQLNEIASNAKEAIAEAINKGAEDVAEKWRNSINSKSGATAESIDVTQEASGDDLHAQVSGGGNPVVGWLEEGTDPHPIPKEGNTLLAFEWDGELVFFMHVDHPGTAPQNLAEHAAEESIDDIVSEIESALSSALQ